MLLIQNGRIIDPAGGMDMPGDLLIENSKIIQVGKVDIPPVCEVIDATGLVLAPGLIDTHVHFRDPGFTHKEDLHTGALSAARGGYTTVVCMANTNPVVDTVETLQDILTRAEKEPINILQAAAVTKGMKGEEVVDMAALKEAGAVLFTDDGIAIMDREVLVTAMVKAEELGVVISLHEEDPALVGIPGVNEGEVAGKLGLPGASALSEISLVDRDMMFAVVTGAKVVVQHISTARAVFIVRFAKSKGAQVEVEATPHHFSLTEETVLKHGTLAKMNPPLRTEHDRLAIIEGLKDGTIGIIATDHAPHHKDEKAKPFSDAPSGIIGLETALALGITHLVQPGHLTLPQLLEKMTVNPAQLLGIPVGTLTPGASADIVLFDPGKQWKVENFASKSSNSPFIGQTLTGQVVKTICRGKVVYSL